MSLCYSQSLIKPSNLVCRNVRDVWRHGCLSNHPIGNTIGWWEESGQRMQGVVEKSTTNKTTNTINLPILNSTGVISERHSSLEAKQSTNLTMRVRLRHDTHGICLIWWCLGNNYKSLRLWILTSLESLSLPQPRPFWLNLFWLWRFFCPPSANLHSKGSAGAAKERSVNLGNRQWN